ncbi:seryl-tRNA synthetase-like protein [Myriangium duriaei CBS 260.36]|uniref:serine--tRNA ligase n=1 Tax=Myriangium duriaei CBS 260.36 TaxID=1168546 RepID=A0A9P4IZB0_9PEZI|nr:seryl-tRNA synthetase-like protein [Myriangium duriaei CBS 260.36]
MPQARPRLPLHHITPCRRRAFSRPAFAPKPVVDIKHIRQNPGLYEQNCISRNYAPLAKNSWQILDLHKQWTELQLSSRTLREKNNTVRRHLANAASSPDSAANKSRTELIAEAKEYKTQLDAVATQEAALEAEIESLALQLPNLSSAHTPDGSDPVVLEYINDHPEPAPERSDRVWRSHVHVGAELGLLDFSAAATTSGWGWYFLLDEGAALEHALVQYALSIARQRGWRTASPPSIVYSHIASACGFMPRDANGETQIYSLASESDKPALVLAGTAEIPFAGMKAGQTLDEADLPLKIIGPSRCYRAEAGARGVDTKGLYRVHEFTKVEMFAWTAPDSSSAEKQFDTDAEGGAPPQERLFEEMLDIQRTIIAGLGLHARVLEMPATDLGASAQRKIDIEAYFPSRRERDGGWGEVSSLSWCGDYQTRRLGTRLKRSPAHGAKMDWPFTLNGTALAVPRVLAAIMELGWDEVKKEMRVPEVLRPWMGGVESIQRKH